jgi:hypothetical protein
MTTMRYLRRSSWKKVVMTDLVISTINAITEQNMVDYAVGKVIAPAVARQVVIKDDENDPKLED